MKKMKRILALTVLLALCLSLCGCNALDNLRQSRATMPREGLLRFQDGTEYKRLPECEELYPDYGDGESIYIVEDDLPLLLTSWGTYASKSEDGRFIRTYADSEAGIYCRSDLYESLVARIEQGFTPEVYCYSYYDPRAGEYGENVLYELTPAQKEAVDRVYATQNPEKLPAVARLEYEDRADLFMYSSDHLFRQDTVDICTMKGEYYLLTNDNSLYTVPEELHPIFADIMEKLTGYPY